MMLANLTSKRIIMLKRLLLCCLLTLCSLPLSAAENGHDAIGLLSQQQLLTNYAAFADEYGRFTPTQQDLEQMQALSGASLVVLFGSWCHDSEREVPRLLKLIAMSGVELESLQLQAVDRSKQHPDKLHTDYELRYTPTFIVLRDGKELGRVIEKPQQSLAADLSSIAGR